MLAEGDGGGPQLCTEKENNNIIFVKSKLFVHYGLYEMMQIT